MLNFLQSQLRIGLFVFMVFFFISLSCALELGISPPILIFEGHAGEKLCESVKIFSDRDNINLVVDDKWTINKLPIRDLNFYNKNSKEIGITSFYSKRIFIEREYEGKICFLAREKGKYQGLLSFDTKDKSLGIGIWIIVNATNGKNSLSLITGKVSSIGNETYQNFWSYSIFLLLFMFLLLIILFILIRRVYYTY